MSCEGHLAQAGGRGHQVLGLLQGVEAWMTRAPWHSFVGVPGIIPTNASCRTAPNLASP